MRLSRIGKDIRPLLGSKQGLVVLMLALLSLLAGCSDDGDDRAAGGTDANTPTATNTGGAPNLPSDPLTAKLADAYRIAPSEIDLQLDYFPSRERVEGSVALHFRMRDGETKPLFDFNPLRRSATPELDLLKTVELDGEPLDPQSRDDLRLIRPAPGAERGYEIERELSDGDAHTLKITWEMPKPIPPNAGGWFFTNYDDTEGPDDETEALWPTINSPDVYAKHRIDLRVHSSSPYTVIGSGEVGERSRSGRVQSWQIATRPLPSNVVFFAAAPSDRLRTSKFKTGGVEVTIASNLPPDEIAHGGSIARHIIPKLISNFGPFPMPWMQILLTPWNSGMEYYGATRTGVSSLSHELGHMYFGVTTIERTWRDTWFDEAAVVWWQSPLATKPVGPEFRSSLGSGASPVAPGFDTSAYGPGARVMSAIAKALGGTEAMRRFLGDFHRRNEFKSFTTEDFINAVLERERKLGRGKLNRNQLERWLLSPASA